MPFGYALFILEAKPSYLPPRAGMVRMNAEDMANVSKVARVATAWIPGIDIGPILAELRGRMAEELDYRLESASIRRMRVQLRRHRIYVPKVFRRLARERVHVRNCPDCQCFLPAECLASDKQGSH